jgi:ribose-phosphate pyrophosphokinase
MNIITFDTLGNSKGVEFDSFTFSGGEEHVRFNPQDFINIAKIEIHARLIKSASLVQLMMVNDALKRLVNNSIDIELVIPYFPYARQDRVCVEGEAFGAAVMAEFINSLGFNKVTIWDAHSKISPSLINNVVNVAQLEILQRCDALTQRIATGELILVSPDAGASKKTEAIAKAYPDSAKVIQARKRRDLETGTIIKTEVEGDIAGKQLLIVDDICDGGRTFIELAKVLKAAGASYIGLFVTHGIFSKGIEVFEGLIDEIYTTDSFPQAESRDNATNINIIQ